MNVETRKIQVIEDIVYKKDVVIRKGVIGELVIETDEFESNKKVVLPLYDGGIVMKGILTLYWSPLLEGKIKELEN